MSHQSGRKTRGAVFTLLFLLCALILQFPAGADTAGATLANGAVVNARMKSLAAGENVSCWTETGDITAIRMADSLPEGFVPSAANTISASGSESPVYIFFEKTDGAGIMYVYTEGGRIALNPDSGILFRGHRALKDISGVAGWDASRVTNMWGIFSHAPSLPDALALRNWDTSSVTDMSFMFSGDVSLKFVDVSNWNTGRVTSMASMFQVGESHEGNGALTEILGIEKMDVSNVTDMTCMFYGAGSMTFYNIGGWDVSKVESMNHMFCDNFSLKRLDLSQWDVSGVRTVYCMFDDNYQLMTIGDVSRWNTSGLVDAGGWLNGSRSFTGNEYGVLDLSGWDTGSLRSTGEMFYQIKAHTIDLTGWTFDSVTNEKWDGAGGGMYYETGNDREAFRGMGGMFMETTSLKAVYLSRSGLESFEAAVGRGVNTEYLWLHSKTKGFTVK